MTDVTKLQNAAIVATVVADTLAANPGQPMTAGTVSALLATILQAAGPANPNLAASLALGSIALNAIHVATSGEAGFTPEQIKSLIVADDAAIAADKAAHPSA